MRLGVVIAGVCAVVVSTVLVVVVLSPRQVVETKAAVPDPEMLPTSGEGFPPLSKSPPYPKAVVDATEYDFGRMEVGDQQSHVFTIRNDGEAPLKIVQGPKTCQCTVGELETGELAAGKSSKITLTWKPAVQAEQFGKGVEIRTNDPEHRSIHFRILGMVVPRLVAFPERTWETPDVLEGEPATFTGFIVSPVAEAFQILALESRSPLLSAESLPIGRKQLEAHHGRSGYSIRVTVSRDVPIGAFAFPLKIKTDLPERSGDGRIGQKGIEMDVLVTGHRGGPIRILSTAWDEKNMAVVLGSFDAAAGKKVTLPMFVRGAGAEDFRLTEPPVSDPSDLHVAVEREAASSGAAKHPRYRLEVEYPAGAPNTVRRAENPAKIRLRTNLPGAPEIELSVFFAAY